MRIKDEPRKAPNYEIPKIHFSLVVLFSLRFTLIYLVNLSKAFITYLSDTMQLFLSKLRVNCIFLSLVFYVWNNFECKLPTLYGVRCTQKVGWNSYIAYFKIMKSHWNKKLKLCFMFFLFLIGVRGPANWIVLI